MIQHQPSAEKKTNLARVVVGVAFASIPVMGAAAKPNILSSSANFRFVSVLASSITAGFRQLTAIRRSPSLAAMKECTGWAAAKTLASFSPQPRQHRYYREALLLTEWPGLTQDAMGKRLGLSSSGAKSRVQRARRQLKKLLLDCCRLELDRRGNVLEMVPRRKKCRATC